MQEMPDLEQRIMDVRKEMLERNSPEDLVIMSHLFTHLIDQVKVQGPMREHWMFCFEDYFGVLKSKVKTRSHPTPSIMKAIQLRQMIDMVQGILHQSRTDNTPRLPLTLGDTRRNVNLRTDTGAPRQSKVVQITLEERKLFHTWLMEEYPEYMTLYQKFERSLDAYRRYTNPKPLSY